jgi:hypothetical protein
LLIFVSSKPNFKKTHISGEPLGIGCYKIRLAIDSKSSGKSGGARVVTCVRIIKEQIDLLTIYDKSERSTIKKHELKKLVKLFVK